MAATDAAPSHTDVITAVVSASGALTGLVLVFLGVLVASYQTLLGQVSKDKVQSIKRPAWAAVGVFLLGLGSLATSVAWLIAGGGRCFYIAALVVFFALLVGLSSVAVYSARILLR